MHNGVIAQWPKVRRILLCELKTPTAFDYALHTSPIDSVLLFSLFIDQLDKGVDGVYSADELRAKLENVLLKVTEVLTRECVTDEVSYLNCVVSDGRHIVGSRYSIGGDGHALSLYFATGTSWEHESYAGHGDYRMRHLDKRTEVCILTSEPLTEIREEWVPVPHDHMIVITKNCDVVLKRVDNDTNATDHIIRQSLAALESVEIMDDFSTVGDYDSRNIRYQVLNPHPLLCCVYAEQFGVRILFTGDDQGKLTTWEPDFVTNNVVDAHRGSVLSLIQYQNFSIISGGADTTVCIWHISWKNFQVELKLRLCFSPLQGDVLSLVVISDLLDFSSLDSKKADYLFIGYQSTKIGFINLSDTHLLDRYAQSGASSSGDTPFKLDLGHSDSTNQPLLYNQSFGPFSDDFTFDVNSSSVETPSFNWNILGGSRTLAHFGFVESLTKWKDNLISGGGDGLIIIWKRGSRKVWLSGHTGGILCLCSDEINGVLYSGSRDKTIRVWDISAQSCTQVLRTHQYDVMALHLSGQYLISASTTSEIFIWSTKYLEVISRLSPDGYGICNSSCITHISQSPSDRSIVATATDGIIRFWSTDNFENSNLELIDSSLIGGSFDKASPQKRSSLPIGENVARNNWSEQTELDVTQKNLFIEGNRSVHGQSEIYGSFRFKAMERMLKIMIPICSISGNSRFLVECWRMAKLIRSYLEEMGFATSVVPTGSNQSPIVYGKTRIDNEKPTVLFYSHYDVVNAANDGQPISPPKSLSKDVQWNTDPWQLSIVNGYLYGRGTSDNKGPITAQLMAIHELKKDPPVNIIFICEGEEENGSRGFSEFLVEHLQELKIAKYAILTNTYGIDDDTPSIVRGMRGVIDMQISVTGGHDLHSGIHGGAIHEPMQDLVEIIHDIAEHSSTILTTNQNIDDNQVPSTIFNWEQYRQETGYASIQTNDSHGILKKRWFSPCLSVAEIWSSTQPATLGQNFRVLPSVAGCNISIRTVPFQNADVVLQELSSRINKCFSARQTTNIMNLKVLKNHTWWNGDIQSPLFLSATQALKTVWNKTPAMIYEGGTIPVTRQIQDLLEVATIQIPIGQASDNAHLPNERLKCLNLVKGVDVIKLTLAHLAKIHCDTAKNMPK